MADVIQMTSTDLGGEDFAWLVGAAVAELEFIEPYSWRFDFTNGGTCAMDGGTWRLSSARGIVACSDDHRHPFGLPQPFDARAEALAALGTARVSSSAVGPLAPDLLLHFENGLVLELLALSRGYECWQVAHPSGRHLVVSGSRAASTWRE